MLILISQTLLSKDTYSARDKIVIKGTKKIVAPTKSEQVEKEKNIEQEQQSNE